MLQIQGRVCEGCDRFSYVDTTGLYNATTNPTGYGPANIIEGPLDFDTYTLDVWFPGSDVNGPADYTYNLQTSVPTPDANDYYNWVITKSMLGVSRLISGVWNMRATGVRLGITYYADVECIFTEDLASQVDRKMLTYDPMCPCKKGCENPTELSMQLLTIKCGGICDPEKAQRAISNLYTRIKNCC